MRRTGHQSPVKHRQAPDPVCYDGASPIRPAALQIGWLPSYPASRPFPLFQPDKRYKNNSPDGVDSCRIILFLYAA
jgi:hypothetical protein